MKIFLTHPPIFMSMFIQHCTSLFNSFIVRCSFMPNMLIAYIHTHKICIPIGKSEGEEEERRACKIMFQSKYLGNYKLGVSCCPRGNSSKSSFLAQSQ